MRPRLCKHGLIPSADIAAPHSATSHEVLCVSCHLVALAEAFAEDHVTDLGAALQGMEIPAVNDRLISCPLRASQWARDQSAAVNLPKRS